MAYTTINDPEAHFQAKLYSGTGSDQSITLDGTSNLQPDLIWVKRRDGTGTHGTVDSVRGANKWLASEGTGGEDTSTENITFGSDGFTWNGGNYDRNSSGETYVAWCWKANGSGSSNGNGSISSTVSANTTAGISIVTFTGTGSNATVGHGLGAAPKCMWVKGRGNATQWNIYNASLGANKHLNFDSNEAEQSYTNRFNDTDPTSTVFTIGTDAETNPSSGTMVAYCFAEIQGYSKFSSYIGNGNADGPMLFTGFSPAWIMCKKSSASGDSWTILDNKRDTFNVSKARLFPDQDAAESTSTDVGDFLSNGFKIRTTAGTWNDSGGTYVFMAFAESPFVNSNGVPNNAR